MSIFYLFGKIVIILLNPKNCLRIMNEFTFRYQKTPLEPFSFLHWSKGYIFSRLERTSPLTFQKCFVVAMNGSKIFVRATFEKQTVEADTFPLTITVNCFALPGSQELANIPVDHLKRSLQTEIDRYLGLDDNYSGFYKLITDYDQFSHYLPFLSGYRLSGVLSLDWMPIYAFLSTNTTLKSYYLFLDNITSYWGHKISYNNQELLSLPLLDDLIYIDEIQFRKTKIGYRAKYFPLIINTLVKEPLYWANSVNTFSERYKFLLSIKGLGEYSARTTLLYGLKDYSVAFVDSFIRSLMHEFFYLTKETSVKVIYTFLEEHFHPYQGLLLDWLTAVKMLENNNNSEIKIKQTYDY